MTMKTRILTVAKRIVTDTLRLRPDLYLLIAVGFLIDMAVVTFLSITHGSMTGAEAQAVLRAGPRLFALFAAVPLILAVGAAIVRPVARRAGHPDVFRQPYIRRSEHEAALEELRAEIEREVRAEMQDCGDAYADGGVPP